MHWLQKHASKSVQYHFTKLDWLTARDPKEGAKIICNFVFLSQKQAIRKKQTTLLQEEKEPECLICEFRCTGWQNTPQNLFNNSLPNLIVWLQQTLSKEQTLFGSYSFELEGQL